ncbi:MAG TPA: PolC-type DNA polymerase III, partial [Firmicutes bacterium]|nr:PolC-type DNA polymerase III [Bacillota bacterium]
SSKNNFKIITLKITDKTDSYLAKIFTKDGNEYKRLSKSLKKGIWIKIEGQIKYDDYAKDLVLTARNIVEIPSKDIVLKDDAKIKRVELHSHTMMSQMDGVLDVNKYLDTLHKLGYKAVAITDHNGAQSFPEAFGKVNSFNKGIENDEDKFKVLYGTELVMIEDSVDIVIRPVDLPSLDATYCVFDLETTGFNAGGEDTIIEIGAVLIKNGEIIDRFDELINPGHPLNAKITEVTNITNEMLADKDTEENAVKRFIEFFKDYPMVAHNAKFDCSFIEMAYQKYGLGEFTNCVIDTLELSRTLDSGFARHGLSAIVKRYNVEWDESAHHRGDYDAEGTAKVFAKMLEKMYNQNIENIKDFNSLVSKDEIYKYGRSYHVNILVQNKVGLKNLFKLISLANTKYLYKTPRILRSEITKHREGLLIGSGCYESEIFNNAKRLSEEELSNLIAFYDYVEVQPPEVYSHLIELGEFYNNGDIENHLKKIIECTKNTGKIIVATGDVHHLTREDKISREIIVNQKVPGGGRHPLAKSEISSIPSQHFRTTDEMLKDFSFLDEDLREEIVITNTNKIADLCEIVEVIIPTGGHPFAPKIKDSDKIVTEMVYEKAKSIYGDPLPKIIEDRIESELKGILKMGYDVIYLIAQKLVKHSNEDGYLVGSRGSVGSSFVATMMGITEVNPLPVHYVCPNCKYTTFDKEDGTPLSADCTCGYDLPDKKCPNCGEMLSKQGHDMPFATFLGFDADKVPDIDLNFSGENQASAHEYTKVLFGVDNVYRAGTVGTVADKTAYGFVKGYCETKGITNMKSVEIERLAAGCTGVKRTTGQHPGGIVVIPDYMDVYDFTPFQYPADDPNSAWRTTHFEYHSLEDDILKLDILGHDDPTVLRMLQDLSGLDVTKVPLGDPDTMKIFLSPEVLGVTEEDIECKTGTLGVPEFGTRFVVGMLSETKPKTFAELVKISGLSHGTDVWTGNARDLILSGTVEFKDVIGCRDDIMITLSNWGMDPKKAFKIMEFVRKGKASKDPETWSGFAEDMKSAGVPDWYIDTCGKIKYMFPK